MILTSTILFLLVLLNFFGNGFGRTGTNFVQEELLRSKDKFRLNLNRLRKDEPRVKLILTGDVMLGRTVEVRAKEVGSYSYPFEKVTDRLKGADIVFVNLENPIIENCPKHSIGFKFCANPEMLEGLVESGIDIVSLANNHAGNYGKDGIDQTLQHLKKEGIKATGLGGLEILEVKSTDIGFLGFDFTVSEPSEIDYNLISTSSAKVDLLIVSVHWGTEYTRDPFALQRVWAQEIIKRGASVIVGHHPHWVQTREYYDQATILQGESFQKGLVPVYYSLGNFVFDQMWSEETRRGEVIELTIENGEFVDEKLMQVYMREHAQPEFVEN